MNISIIGNFMNNAIQSNSTTTGRVDQDGDNDNGKKVRGGRRAGGQMLSALAQTLNQLGVGTIAPTAVPPTSATKSTNHSDGSTGDATSNGQDVRLVL